MTTYSPSLRRNLGRVALAMIISLFCSQEVYSMEEEDQETKHAVNYFTPEIIQQLEGVRSALGDKPFQGMYEAVKRGHFHQLNELRAQKPKYSAGDDLQTFHTAHDEWQQKFTNFLQDYCQDMQDFRPEEGEH